MQPDVAARTVQEERDACARIAADWKDYTKHAMRLVAEAIGLAIGARGVLANTVEEEREACARIAHEWQQNTVDEMYLVAQAIHLGILARGE